LGGGGGGRERIFSYGKMSKSGVCLVFP
jgi:hypothetical protein